MLFRSMITQLLLMDGYIEFDDLLKGRITEKVNRETIAAAKYAVLKELERRKKSRKTASSSGAGSSAGGKGRGGNKGKTSGQGNKEDEGGKQGPSSGDDSNKPNE